MLQTSTRIPGFHIVAVLAASLAAAGCGKSKKEETGPPVAKHIITSAMDCTEAAGLTYDVCQPLIEKAVTEHQSNATKYTSLKACEGKEGATKCEKVADKDFRPKLAAFLLTMSEPPVAVPLYASADASIGFRGADNTKFSSEDDKFTFSKSATHAAELFAASKPAGGGGGLL